MWSSRTHWLFILASYGALLVGRADAQSLVLCARQKSDGTISTTLKVRPACKSREVQLDPVALGLVGPPGPPGPQGPAAELPWTDVTDFGAAGDGLTDDTVAIQDAISATPVGGTLFFPLGNYVVSDELLIDKRINVAGVGRASQLYQEAPDRRLLVFQPSGSGLTVQGITVRDIYLGSAATTPGTSLLALTRTHLSQFENITMLGGYYGVHLLGSLLNTFVGLRSGVNSQCNPPSACAGFFASTSTNQNWVFAERLNTGSPISSNANSFFGLALEGGTNGFWLQDLKADGTRAGEGDFYIFGGTIEGVSGIGLYAHGGTLPSTVTGVHFEGNGHSDVVIDSARAVRIESSLMTGIVQIADNASDVVVSSSTVGSLEILGHCSVSTSTRCSRDDDCPMGAGCPCPGESCIAPVRTRIETVRMGSGHIYDDAGDTIYVAFTPQGHDPAFSSIGLGTFRNPAPSWGTGGPNGDRLLDVDGNVRATSFSTGDLFFRKDGRDLWRMYEDETGLFLEDPATGKSSRVLLERDVANLTEQVAEQSARRAVEAVLGPACWSNEINERHEELEGERK